MAKKKKSESTGAIGQLVDPKKADDLPEFGLSATTELNVSTDGIVDIIVTEFEDRIDAELAKGREAIRAQHAVVADRRSNFDAALKKAVVKACSKERAAAKTFYKALGLACDVDVTHEVEGDLITLEFKWYSKKTKRYSDTFDYHDTFDFTKEVTPGELGVTQQFKELRVASATLKELKDLVQAWNARKSEIRQVERRTRAHLAKAALSRSKGGDALYNELMGRFNQSFESSELTSFNKLV